MSNMLCCIVGHRYKGKHIPAYSISSNPRTVDVKIYDVCRCERCGKMSFSCIDSYTRYCSCAERYTEKEEKELRRNGFVSLSEAYQILVADHWNVTPDLV